MYSLIIFDCDGVLVDSEPLAAAVMMRHLEPLGLAMTAPEIEAAFVGRSMPDVVATIARLSDRPVPEGWLEDLQRDTFKAFDEALTPVPGIAELLFRLAEAGLPFCVASSGSPEKIRHSLGLTGLLPFFDGHIFSALDVPRGKPAPDLFLKAAAEMGAAPETCAVIEDSLPGVQAAKAAGMTAFGFAPQGNGQSLAAAGAQVFHTMNRLWSLLGLDHPDKRQRLV